MNKQFYKSNFSSEKYLHNTIEYVLNEISNLLRVCYGPYGSHILIANKLGAEAMKDGQRILSSYIPDSSIPTAVLQSLKSVSNKQAEEIGDGTTTTILLLCELYNKFRKIITDKNISPTVFNNKLKIVVDDIINNIDQEKIQILNDNNEINWAVLYNAVYTSVDANMDLADIIIDMFKELDSVDPLIIIDTSTSDTHRYELVKGLELDGAPISSEIFFNGYSRKTINNPKVIMVNGRLDASVEYIMELDNMAMQTESDYIFLCSGIDDDKLSTLVTLKNTNPALLNRVTFFQIKITRNDDEVLDACAVLGANPIDSESLARPSSKAAFNKMIDTNCGVCEKSLITDFCIRFNHPNSNDERLNERIDDINSKINDIKEDPTSHNVTLKELENRKAFLSRNFAKLYVGGQSPQRRTINYELAKDGVLQATSCIKNGVVFGCNTVVPRICNDLIKYNDYDENRYDDIEQLIAEAIYDSYIKLLGFILFNKYGTETEISDYRCGKNFPRATNIREDDNTDVMNSAATDKTILRNATDMASLLATSKAFLSSVPEFDSLNNQ